MTRLWLIRVFCRLPGRLLSREGGQREATLSLVHSFPAAVAAEQTTDWRAALFVASQHSEAIFR